MTTIKRKTLTKKEVQHISSNTCKEYVKDYLNTRGVVSLIKVTPDSTVKVFIKPYQRIVEK